MSYTPINTAVYTASFAGAIAGMGASGWITNQDSNNYQDPTVIAGAFAQAFDLMWDNATQLNDLELAAITAIVQTDFSGRGPGPFDNPLFKSYVNWTGPAGACVALVLESDTFFASQGITPRFPRGNGNVPNAAALSTARGFNVGDFCEVETYACAFEAKPSGSSIPELDVVIDGIGVQWERIPDTSSVKWQQQSVWYIDSILGNNENSGLLGFPLKTGEELSRRVTPDWVRYGNVDIHVSNTSSNIVLNLSYSNSTGLAAGLNIISDSTVVVTTTVATWTPANLATKTPDRISLTGIADLTSHQDQFLFFPATSTGCWLGKINPDGVGNNIAETVIPDSLGPGSTQHVPSPGDAVQILLPAHITSLHIAPQLIGGHHSHVDNITLQNIIIFGLNIVGVSQLTYMWGCSIHQQYIQSDEMNNEATWFSNACRYKGEFPFAPGELSFHAPLIGGNLRSLVATGNTADHLEIRSCSMFNVLLDTCGAFFRGMSSIIGDFFIMDASVNDRNTLGAMVIDTCTGTLAFNLSGRRNANFGLAMRAGADLTRYRGATQNLTGAIGDIRDPIGEVGSDSAIAWPVEPNDISQGQLSGAVKLVGGTKNVTLPVKIPWFSEIGANPQATHNDFLPNAAGIGVLSISATSATVLVITSSVATDISNVNWFLPIPGLYFSIVWAYFPA
jgi:hypothetical protein